jgi:hypothetical protein
MGDGETAILEQQHWRLPDQPTIEDFRTLIRNQFLFYRQRHGYSELSDQDLLVWLVGYESLSREQVIAVLDKPERDWFDVYKQAARMARDPRPEVLQVLHGLGASELHLRFVVRSRLALREIYDELRRRFDRQKFGRAYYRTMLARPGSLEELLAVLHVDRITSFRSGKEGSEDLQGVALEAAVRHLEKFRDEIRKRNFPEQVNFPLIPVLDATSREKQGMRWSWKDLRAREFKETIVSLLPLLRGEELAEKVHSSMKEHFRKWKASKRTGVEIPLYDDGGRPLPEEIERGDAPSVEEQVHRKFVAGLVMQTAKDRWGKKGQLFIHALLEGKNMIEASKAAKISRQTGNKYKLVLLRLLDKG